jgi:hypothetical protein
MRVDAESSWVVVVLLRFGTILRYLVAIRISDISLAGINGPIRGDIWLRFFDVRTFYRPVRLARRTILLAGRRVTIWIGDIPSLEIRDGVRIPTSFRQWGDGATFYVAQIRERVRAAMPGKEGTTNLACRHEVHSPAGLADALIFDTDAPSVRWEVNARGPCKEIP